MEQLNFVNLIQASIVSTSIIGAALQWTTKPKEFRALGYFFILSALAATINILEESGVSRDIYLVSPIFVLLFGPAGYLAIKYLLEKSLAKSQLMHLLPALPLLFITEHSAVVIAIGSIWRIAYALFTVKLLLNYHRQLSEQRSDSDEFSFTWLIWLLTINALFNFIDLIRLNSQMLISHDLNVLGQGINNVIWLVTAILMIIKLQEQRKLPNEINLTSEQVSTGKISAEDANEYKVIFQQLDNIVKCERHFLTPKLTLQDVSDITGLQIRDISRAINLVANKSFNQYINQYRIEYVCEQIALHQHKSLTELSYQAGFSSKATFNQVFKQVTGLTPTAYKTTHTV